MEKNYEVARIDLNIPKDYAFISFQNGRGKYFSTLNEAKQYIIEHKSKHSENFPYIIIHYKSDNGRIVYIEYDDMRLTEHRDNA